MGDYSKTAVIHEKRNGDGVMMEPLLITHYRRPMAIKFEYFINTLRILSSFINMLTRQIQHEISFDYTTCVTGQGSLADLIVYYYSKLIKHTLIHCKIWASWGQMFCKSERQRGVRTHYSAGTPDNSRFTIWLTSPSRLSLSVSTMKGEHSVISDYMGCWGG